MKEEHKLFERLATDTDTHDSQVEELRCALVANDRARIRYWGLLIIHTTTAILQEYFKGDYEN